MYVCVNCSIFSDSLQPHGLSPDRILCPWNSPDKNIGVGCHSLLQVIFPSQGLNPGLPHCRQILYYLSHQESPCVYIVVYIYICVCIYIYMCVCVQIYIYNDVFIYVKQDPVNRFCVTVPNTFPRNILIQNSLNEKIRYTRETLL